jgi:hypothetical protein
VYNTNKKPRFLESKVDVFEARETRRILQESKSRAQIKPDAYTCARAHALKVAQALKIKVDLLK